ncbi:MULTISPECIES: homogentisate 1,2-dioxygenase [Comamonadaceae]|uniref:homogentisate 1,2-dioxygenase n=1 Tax=Xenophilus azovorans TaxID=151755 RepID=UPI0012EDCC53
MRHTGCTPITAARRANRRSRLCRIRPSMMHWPFVHMHSGRWFRRGGAGPVPNQLRWYPLPLTTAHGLQPRHVDDGGQCVILRRPH